MDDIEFEDSQEEVISEEEDVVQRDDGSDEGWEDCEEDENMEQDAKKEKKKPQVWNEKQDPLKEDEELEVEIVEDENIDLQKPVEEEDALA